MLRIVGTSHVAEESVKRVKEAFNEFQPDIVALELDKRRFLGLVNNVKTKEKPDIREIGIKGYLFFLVGRFIQQKIGAKLGVVPGIEMKTAIELAREKGINIALIDRDIKITLKRISQCITWREKWNFVVDFVKGIFKPDRELAARLDLRKVPADSVVEEVIEIVRKRYPGLYKALVEERNEIMAKNILKILSDNPDKKLLVVIGAGHKKGLEEELEHLMSNEIYIAG